ncbi:hypothetical protein RhiirA5_494421 [Rhizophagus irregularis]|uniref:Uncharacterized protein n=2 Tax=Rhizophagus irregularis TaxID=588596 RepID=A0A2N0RSC4_9GLOM|nr:hypothetical protein GLOIN_2v1523184 [Rhizophagus irregularis DAOM 181602=DAOM 197198]PKC15617.1 hypothetical protein RhiirA5_494421 [Rhizophagus irregularis]PKC66193.1 hypothetical protein RhiirA1_441860 [Rhizophagus irregularis]PKK78171.1 hypothetical protein RhiirC2_706022 [Rhizophagus irregularis]POG79779.1 hypothetical protein GLOIN_2v1523184 [Rhizophagus irregularis DAOM 181602=DAOM 197198]UZO04628.1 hypothetical protein OCT59_025003 [Rhizophagus irregularis]|eukprot:XP_025186645.1 hypothetical protein GLOIN_2v1523184 [Rhizophagus irregularis DAOM 181602=DAOM 197198]
MNTNQQNRQFRQFPRQPWNDREDTNLIFLVDFIGINWARISIVLGRSALQCRRRYLRLLALDNIERYRRIFRRRVNRRFRQRHNLVSFRGFFQGIQLLARRNIIPTRDYRMDLNHILNTSQDHRMNINYILSVE